MDNDATRETGGTHASFGTTSWVEVRNAASDADWGGLLRAYREPIYGFFRRLGWSEADSEDLTQAFLVREIEKKGVVGKADPTRGRFRDYLCTALRHFAVDEVRSVRGRGRRPRVLSLDRSHNAADECRDSMHHFERDWAAATVERALERTRAACLASHQRPHLELFEARVVRPSLVAQAMPSVRTIAERAGVSPSQASVMIHTVKRKFRRALQEVVLETLDDPRELDGEIAAVRAALAAG